MTRLLPIVLLAACTPADTDAPSVCWTDLAAGATAVVASGFTDGTEGIAFSDGHLFVSLDSGVTEILPDGSTADAMPIPHALGLAPADGGVLVADPGEFTFDDTVDGGVAYLPGTGAPFATGIPNANALAWAPWGELLVSDDTGDTVWAIDGSTARVWLSGVPSPNGLAFSPSGDALYVATTFAADPPIWRVPVSADGTPGTPVAIATLATGSAPDGLAVGADGAVYVAANLAGAIVRVDPGTGATTEIARGLDSPASLAFGAGDDADPCSLYATSLFGESVTRLSTGGAGLPVPQAPRY